MKLFVVKTIIWKKRKNWSVVLCSNVHIICSKVQQPFIFNYFN